MVKALRSLNIDDNAKDNIGKILTPSSHSTSMRDDCENSGGKCFWRGGWTAKCELSMGLWTPKLSFDVFVLGAGIAIQ